MNRELFDQLGGFPTLKKVHKTFYDKLYAHPWLKGFFKDLEQELIESQQTYFMASIMGGPQQYMGKYPVKAHMHLYITDEMFKIRQNILRESIQEHHISDDLAEQWINKDYAFYNVVVKDSLEDCEQRFPSEPIVVVPRP